MISEKAAETGTRTSEVSASGRPLSDNPDAVRKRAARGGASSRTSSSVGGRGGAESHSKGNALSPDSLFAKAGEPLSPGEAESQLFWGHVGLAKAVRSEIDMEELRPEFHVAGENYAYVANNIWTPLRVVIRFIAPLVLVAVLVVIWGRIIAETPWIHSIRNWWSNRGEQEQPAAPPSPPARDVVGNNGQPPAEPAAAPVQAPPIPRRPSVVRNLRGLHR